MQTIMFGLLAVTAVVSAVLMITRKNPVYSILWLVLAFFCFAGLYVLLGANFLAAIQIVVYAGAIMVLFLFVVMMLNLREPEKLEERSPLWVGMGTIVGLGLGLVLLAYFVRSKAGVGMVEPSEQAYAMGSATWLGKELFTTYVLPVEIAGVLLLAAVIGAVALAKKTRV